MAQDELHVLVLVILKSHSTVSWPIAIYSVCLTILLVFLAVLVKELGANCGEPQGGSWFGCVAEQSPLTDYEPNSQNIVPTDIDDVPTMVASDVTEANKAGQMISPLFTREREVIASPFSASVHQQAAASGSQYHRVA